MRKLLYFAIGLFVFTGCGGGNPKEEILRDSAPGTDSVSVPDSAALKAELARLDSLRLDSLRQDSITRVDTVIAKLPTIEELHKNIDYPTFFRRKGFEVSETKEFYEKLWEYRYILKATYTPMPGVSCRYNSNYWSFDLTVEGAPGVMDSIYVNARAFVDNERKKNPNSRWEAKLEGNTLRCDFGK